MKDFYDKSIFRLSCILSGGIAIISWIYSVLWLNASVPSMTIRCLIFIICLITVTKPRQAGIPLYKKWLALSRRSHGYFLVTPGFIIILSSLLTPFRLPTNLAEWLLLSVGYLILYISLLGILFISGWNKKSPDLLQCQQGRKEDK